MSDLIKAAEKLYLYGFPLIVTEATHRGSDDKGLVHLRKFPTEKITKVVKLNMDTLYSLGWTQLRNTPYIAHIPKITERYYLFPIMDAYTNVVESIGTRTPDKAEGDYLLILDGEAVPEGYENYRIIRLKNSLNAVLLRIETRGKKDYELVNRIQDSITLKPLYEDRVEPVPPEPDKTPSAFAEELPAKDFFELFASLTADDPIDDEEYIRLFGLFGYDPDTNSFDYDSLSEDKKNALASGRENALSIIRKGRLDKNNIVRKRGWTAITGGVGRYGNDYLQRAVTAYAGWGANLIEDSAYISGYADDDGEPFSNSNSYKLHFEPDGYPHAAVFWSLTLYGEPSRYPVRNPIDRFAINTYDIQDGAVHKNNDGSLDIIISKDRPAGQNANWLPAPSDEERFTLVIRVYYPDELTVKGQWEPPAIRKI